MLLDGLHGAQPCRVGEVQANVFRLPTLVLHPFLDDFLVANNAHAGLVDIEWHAREALRMQFAQLVLVIVVVGRAENDAADAALGHEGVLALGRLGGSAFSLVERGEMFPQHVIHRFVLGKPQGIIERANE